MGVFDKLFKGKKEGRKPTRGELLDRVRTMLDTSSMFGSQYVEETANKFIHAGEEGIDVLQSCLNDVFRLRASTMGYLLSVAYKVVKDTKDLRLLSILERVLREGRDLVEGYPRPPAWMPTLKTDIAGEGKYGWSDGTWIPITHKVAEFLLEVLPELPTEVQAERGERLSQAMDHHIQRSKAVRERATYKEAVDKEIEYWKSLRAKLTGKEEDRSVESIEPLEYFECDRPSGDGLCSDNNCPCPQVVIPRGTGYLYIEQSLVDFRRQYPTLESAREAMRRKIERTRSTSGFRGMMTFYRLGPIFVCEQGAKLRNLDLAVAAADAKHWWETGKVPLRATPLAGTEEARRERKRLGLE